MAKIVWIDLNGSRHESEEFNDIKSLRSYIWKNGKDIKVVESLDCNPLDSLHDKSVNNGLFGRCKNLIRVERIIGTSSVEDLSSMFKGCKCLKSVPYFETSNVKNMNCMFRGCSNLESVPYFDTSNVRDMSFMFDGCSSLEIVPLFDTSNIIVYPLVGNLFCMFDDCVNLKSYKLPCDEYNTRSLAIKSYKSEKLLKELNKLWQK